VKRRVPRLAVAAGSLVTDLRAHVARGEPGPKRRLGRGAGPADGDRDESE
jgi:hypothetical protein